MSKYGIGVKELDVTNLDGEQCDEMLDGYRYLFWFVSEYEEPMSDRHDANPGTFYSGMQNVDIN